MPFNHWVIVTSTPHEMRVMKLVVAEQLQVKHKQQDTTVQNAQNKPQRLNVGKGCFLSNYAELVTGHQRRVRRHHFPLQTEPQVEMA